MRQFAFVCALALAAAIAGSAVAQDESGDELPDEFGGESSDEFGDPLSSEELRAVHAGRDMTGCYFNRPEEPVWRERMAADGRLYDLLKGGAEVGRWWTERGGVICFRYTDRDPGPHCFTGRRRGGYYDFYSAFGGEIVATTQCRDEPIS